MSLVNSRRVLAGALTTAAVLAGALPSATAARVKQPPLPYAGATYSADTTSGTKEKIIFDKKNNKKVALFVGGFVCNGSGAKGIWTLQNPGLKLRKKAINKKRTKFQYRMSIEVLNTPITFLGTQRQEMANITVVVDVIGRNHLAGAYKIDAPDCQDVAAFDKAHR